MATTPNKPANQSSSSMGSQQSQQKRSDMEKKAPAGSTTKKDY